jgi:Chaperone of endosialidase
LANASNYVQKAGDTMTGTLNFNGLALRITGDFSNAIVANKLLFQSSTINGITSVAAIPNGTATNASFGVYSSKDPANSQYGYLSAEASSGVVSIGSNAIGTATQPILQFNAAGVERISPNGHVNISLPGDPGIANLNIAGGLSLNSTYDGASAQVRINGGSAYDTLFRADASNFYILLSTTVNGTFNTLRPLAINLASGAVSIDGTNAGTQFGGKVVMPYAYSQFMVGQPAISTDQATGKTLYPGTSINGQGAIYNQVNNDANVYLSKASGYATASLISFMYNNVGCGNIAVASANTCVYNTTSDYRLKENVAELTDGLEHVMQMRPVEFDWKADGHHARGFLAHELQNVVADAVTGKKDEIDAKTLEPKYQGVDLSFLVPDLVSAIQDLKSQLDAALQRINVLEGGNLT